MRKQTLVLTTLALLALSGFAEAQIRQNPGFRRISIPRNDDGSGPAVKLPFAINFFGRIRDTGFVNNNGNITFDAPLATFTPFGLERTQREIIAPFFADVDTRAPGSALVTYGEDTIDGKKAFGANYVRVGYFGAHDDKLNSFQVVLIERSDTGANNFDIEFNYEAINWETGDASDGVNGFGGVSAAVGWSNGSGLPGTSFELPGSRIPGSFLGRGPYSLVNHRQTNQPLGRFVFRARNGTIIPSLTLTTGCPVPSGSLGQPYSFRFAATGSVPPYTWSLVADPGVTLPGLTFSSAGVLAGTPNALGEFGFTVTVSAKDEDGTVTASRYCTIAVQPPLVSITSACPLPAGKVGAAYQARLSASGGTGPFEFAITENSPSIPGLTLSPQGVLSGTPLFSGIYQFAIRARSTASPAGQPAYRQCSISIQPSNLAITSSCPLPNGTGGVPYNYQFRVSGGNPPYRWSAGPGVPAGMGLTPAGLLTGLPTVPNWWPFNVRVTDGEGKQAELGCGVVILFPELKITNACPLPAATTGRSYSQQATASGGSAPYTWQVLGTLPVGLRLGPDGTISGTPSVAGISQFRLIATDRQGQQAAGPCALLVNRGASYSVTSCPLPNGYVNETYTARMEAAGGNEPYLWSPLGNLPPGLSLSTDGVITGTPAAVGNYPVQVRAVDRLGAVTTSSACNLTILPQTLRLTTACPLSDAKFGVDYTTQLTAAGGVAPYTFASSDLPDGLALAADGRLSGKAKAAGFFPFLVRVTDRSNQSNIGACAISVALPDLPGFKFNGLPSISAPATSNIRATLDLAADFPLPLTGEVSLLVQPDTGNTESFLDRVDPIVKFSNGQTTTRFSLAPGQRQVPLTIQSTGTVAGVISLKLTALEMNGNAVTFPAAVASTRVNRLIPVLTDACYAQSSSGFELVISGYSTTRELQSASLSFTTAGGANTFAVDLMRSAGEFFGNDLSVRTGGAFTVRAPFLLPATANPAALGTANVTVTNSVGTTASRQASKCP